MRILFSLSDCYLLKKDCTSFTFYFEANQSENLCYNILIYPYHLPSSSSIVLQKPGLKKIIQKNQPGIERVDRFFITKSGNVIPRTTNAIYSTCHVIEIPTNKFHMRSKILLQYRDHY
jgi:hypothetical protein